MSQDVEDKKDNEEELKEEDIQDGESEEEEDEDEEEEEESADKENQDEQKSRKNRKIILGNIQYDQGINYTKKNFLPIVNRTIFTEEDKTYNLSEYPNLKIFAQFSSLAYKSKNKIEGAKLPKGWELLTVAQNRRCNNGYFGAAFWNGEKKQVLIAHRGTKCKSFGALWTDFWGIVWTKHVQQINTAVTFTHHVLELISSLGIHFQVFFTGHSLGGWLSQVTTFSSKHLTVETREYKKVFLKADEELYHAHTVVFESPGFAPMLEKFLDKFNRYDITERTSALNVSNYLTAPNLVNCCTKHVGQIFVLWKEQLPTTIGTLQHTLNVHKMKKILDLFEGNKTPKFFVARDWPYTKRELKMFLKKSKNHRFRIEKYSPKQMSLNVFSDNEKKFLTTLLGIPEMFRNDIETNIENEDFLKELWRLCSYVEIEYGDIKAKSSKHLRKLIPYVKSLLKCDKNVTQSLSKISENNINELFKTFQKNIGIELTFENLAENFTEDILNVENKLVHIVTKTETRLTLLRLNQLLREKEGGCFQMGTSPHLKDPIKFDILIKFLRIESQKHFRLVIECQSYKSKEFDGKEENLIKKLIEFAIKGRNIWLLSSEEDFRTKRISNLCLKAPNLKYKKVYADLVKWSDLEKESKEALKSKTSLKFQGNMANLSQLLDPKELDQSLETLNSSAILSLIKGTEIVFKPEFQKLDFNWKRTFYDFELDPTVFTEKSEIFLISGDDTDVDKLLCSIDDFELLFQERLEFTFDNLKLEFPDKNIHYLKIEKERIRLVKSTDCKKIKNHFKSLSLEQLLSGNQEKRKILIVGNSESGKTSSLKKIREQLKENDRYLWVFELRLDRLTSIFRKNPEINDAVDYLTGNLLNLQNFQKHIFMHSIKCSKKVFIIVDGFDEIPLKYEKLVFELLSKLDQNTKIEFACATTKNRFYDEFENLGFSFYYFKPLTETEQVDFLAEYCIETAKKPEKTWKNVSKKAPKEISPEEKETWKAKAQVLIQNFRKISVPEDEDFTGTPNNLVILSNFLEKEMKKPEISDFFVKKKFETFEKRTKGLERNSMSEIQHLYLTKRLTAYLEKLGASQMFPDLQNWNFTEEERFFQKEAYSMGLTLFGKFWHSLFAQYFAAKYVSHEPENSSFHYSKFPNEEWLKDYLVFFSQERNH